MRRLLGHDARGYLSGSHRATLYKVIAMNEEAKTPTIKTYLLVLIILLCLLSFPYLVAIHHSIVGPYLYPYCGLARC